MNQRMYKALVLLLVAAALVLGVWWRLDTKRPGRTVTPADASAATEPNRFEQPLATESANAGPEAASRGEGTADEEGSEAGAELEQASPEVSASAAETPQYPAVIDLGMGKCIPCKQMKPILDQLAQEYEGRCRIEIIDIGERPDQSDKYRVMLIPTQVFLDNNGNEVFRHEGFMPKEDIVAKLNEMGVD